MCGFYGETFNLKRDETKKLSHLLNYRGNDELNVSIEDDVFLMHSRLSITGTKHNSSQPIKSSCDRYHLVFNGEIYSIYGEDSEYLREYGDTLALLKAIEKYGVEDCFLRLNGMFSIVIHDLKENKIIMANDYFGQKPLYYKVVEGQGVIFGSTGELLSEGKALDKDGVQDYITFGFVLPENSIYSDVNRARPGSLVVYDLVDKRLSITESYQNNNFYLDSSNNYDINLVLQDVMRDHSYSDFPIALALSGGVDSTLLYGVLDNETREKINAFTVKSDDVEESQNALLAVDYYGGKTELLDNFNVDSIELLKELILCLDEPNSDTAILSSSSIFRLASRNSKVIFLGDGGDELFQGYNRHKIWNLLSRFPKDGFVASTLISSLILPLVKVAAKIGKLSSQKLVILNNILSNLDDKRMFILSSLAIDDFNKYKYLENDSDFEGYPINFIDRKLYLPGNNLYRVDRLSLLYNIEARAPLLDLRVANASDKTSFKEKSTWNKSILKRLRNSKYTGVNFDGKKMGFNTSVKRILQSTESQNYIDNAISKAKEFGFDFRGHTLSDRRRFNLLCFGLWLERM
ncbi:asparagine synthetase B [Bacterioplanoides sp. SCSIO 12839]|uniref:asparagine synthetase B family protein n=1 Tax=Bacterioplanoides sp. SCSIO 12839 TaxID=2829569 RepID=UPI002103CB9A|nr:asparagine synthase-related protein [Bacterioplanoides sp. SCSIO 12839]UTW49490.1 hypothetical protein KFF03_06250 [Bacterioplanoides sp. SCSIO 12839]